MITGLSMDRDAEKVNHPTAGCIYEFCLCFSFYISKAIHRLSTVQNLSSKRRKKTSEMS